MRLKDLAECRVSLWIPPTPCPAGAGGLASEPYVRLPTLQRRRVVDPDAQFKTAASVPLQIGPLRARYGERCLGDGLRVGQAL